MSQSGRVPPDDLPDEAPELPEEPVIETPVLNFMSDADPPTPNDFCACLIDRVRDNVRARRTQTAVAERVAQNLSQPVTQAFELELTDRVRRNIERRLEE